MILFFVILLLLFLQVSSIDSHTWISFQLKNIFILILAVLLVVVNIWAAYFQWVLTVNIVKANTSKLIRVQSFFAGIVTGILTPNMLGNFIGRLFYFERKVRIPILLLTLLTNMAQFIATLCFGWIAFTALDNIYIEQTQFNIYFWLGSSVVSALLVYFFIDTFLKRVKRKTYFNDFQRLLKQNKTYRFKILLLSFLRFFVFTTQFALLLIAFGEHVNMTIILGIWQVYLITMIFPSIILGKIGVRESVALFVLGALGVNEYSILFTSLLIWLVNNLLPAFIGLYITRNKSTHV